MRLHPTLVQAVIDNLQEIFHRGLQADKVIKKKLQSNKKWGKRDRQFIAQYSYDLVRWWRLAQYISQTEGKTDSNSICKLFGSWLLLKDIDLPTWKEFEGLDKTLIKQRFEEAQAVRAIRESIPDWLDKRSTKELGSRWDYEIKAMNVPAETYIRVNRIKTGKASLIKKLHLDNISTQEVDECEDALLVEGSRSLLHHEAYKKGFFELQDAASQMIAPLLDVQPNHFVIDACAGAGGKTLHLSALMRNRGKIVALDTNEYKLRELERRVKRNGCRNIKEIELIDGIVIERLKGKADRLLLDVPCSGMGVLKRKPDSKWKLTSDFLAKLRKTQQIILQDYCTLLKPGGKMLYATCSIFPSENEKQIETFLANHPEQFELIDQRSFSPSEDGFDGFFVALLQRR